MENKIKYSPLALNDLDRIWDYISTQLLNPTAAENTVNGILDAVDSLKQFPKKGAVLEFSDNIKSNYRFVQYKNYMAFYRINQNEIFIDRIIYGKRDYMKVLSENALVGKYARLKNEKTIIIDSIDNKNNNVIGRDINKKDLPIIKTSIENIVQIINELCKQVNIE